MLLVMLMIGLLVVVVVLLLMMIIVVTVVTVVVAVLIVVVSVPITTITITVIIIIMGSTAHQRPGRLSLFEQSESRIIRLVIVSITTVRLRWWWSLAQFRHQTHVLLIDLIRTRHHARLLRPTVLGNMSSPATDRAQDIIRHIRLVRTQPALVLGRATIITPWRIRLPQRAIQLGQLPQLHPSQVVVALGHFDALRDHLLDLVHRLLHRLGRARRDERVQRLILAGQRLPIFAAHLALLHRPLATDYDLGARVLLHRLQRVAARSDQQAHKVDVRMLLLRNEHLVADTNHRGSIRGILELKIKS